LVTFGKGSPREFLPGPGGRDDDHLVASAIANMLTTIGCQVVNVANTKADAMAIIASDDSGDIALIDINLDLRHGGVDVAKAAAACCMRVIIVTADDHVPDGIAGEGLLLKPFLPEHLEAVVAGIRDRDGGRATETSAPHEPARTNSTRGDEENRT
jgi:DNA-binding response OmpR family regulator